jgi:RNA polymerase sigma-70 factor, ECF subfamily
MVKDISLPMMAHPIGQPSNTSATFAPFVGNTRSPHTAHSADDIIADLIQRSWNGDVHAFNQIVEHYQQRIYALCFRIVGEADAADTTQEAFISAFCNIRRYHGGSFLAWLLRIARNECYDLLRARKRRMTVSLDEDDGHTAPMQVADSCATPDDRLMRAELAHELQRTLQALKPDQRLVVVLCDIEGYSYEEVASVTGWALGTVKSRLSRGRARLRVALRAHARYAQA